MNNIAKMINRNKSTISREVKRNSSPTYDVYLPHKANQRAKSRKQLSGKRQRLKNSTVRTFVIDKLKIGWSPELIAYLHIILLSPMRQYINIFMISIFVNNTIRFSGKSSQKTSQSWTLKKT